MVKRPTSFYLCKEKTMKDSENKTVIKFFISDILAACVTERADFPEYFD